MKILFYNKYVEIKACKEKKFLGINQRQTIQDTEELDKLVHNIQYYADVTKYDSIIFSVNTVDFSKESTLLDTHYLSDIHHSGIKNLLFIVPDDMTRDLYQEEMRDFTENSGLQVEFFKNEQNAIQWITHKPKEILITQ